MSKHGRPPLATRYKVLLWVFGLFALWQFLMNDHISNTLLDLILGGQVPGTKTVLAPNTVIVIVIVLFVLGVVGIIVTSWLNYRGRKRLTLDKQVPDMAAAGKSEVATRVHIQNLEPKKGDVRGAYNLPMPKFSNTKHRQDLATFATPKGWLGTHWRSFNPWLKRSKHTALHLLGLANLYVLAGYELARRRLLQAWTLTTQKSTTSWQWAKPYLFRFDTWLELRIAELEIWLSMRLRRLEALTFCRYIFHEAKLLAKELPNVKAAKLARKHVRNFKRRQ